MTKPHTVQSLTELLRQCRSSIKWYLKSLNSVHLVPALVEAVKVQNLLDTIDALSTTNKGNTMTTTTQAVGAAFAADGVTPTYTAPGLPIMVSAVEFNRVHSELAALRTELARPQEVTDAEIKAFCKTWFADEFSHCGFDTRSRAVLIEFTSNRLAATSTKSADQYWARKIVRHHALALAENLTAQPAIATKPADSAAVQGELTELPESDFRQPRLDWNSVNAFVHEPGTHFEELQGLCLALASVVENATPQAPTKQGGNKP